MFSSKSNCPVPFDQQPLNEYLSLKRSWLFAWSISSKRSFLLGLIFIFVILFIFFSFLLVLFYSFNDLFQYFVSYLIISNFVLFFLFVRLYLGWSYIVKRLLSATVFYEESGWYDGQVWIKTSEYLIQDRLIGLYEVMPFILRIKYAFLGIIINFLFIYLINYVF
uniref:Ycf36 n=1 Tax=Polysiphonia urceolata TaxID=173545 RepID=A0A1Z1MCE0_POLUR|nr:hypothetical protein [Polysiphonia stricta]ARW63542.1 hypothetical protein [Polysiphonia stricta]